MAYFGFKDVPSLSAIDMTIYRYVTENKDEVVYMRVRDIAQNAHVSNSSVMRFIHKVGFSSFPEFKSYLKNLDLNMKGPIKFKFIGPNNFPNDIHDKITMVADLIYQSDNVITIGLGDSAFLAGYAARKLAALGINSEAITDPFYPLATKMKNTSNSTLIIFSVSGKTSELVELLNYLANNADVTMISVTGNSQSKIANMSRYILSYIEPERRNGYFDMSSQVPVMYIIESLVNTLDQITSNE
ncbi:MurR/RpiR family transcriptional regulator [Lactobacillus amylovorus]|jgi:DNA-binding MurR/RpiR family transcriptional regulator|uniref:MurR/RpiR family transcriptional regulator n=1 Tax=Lactobacillus amylovorus TaxID=1604 RepID=UPI0021A398F5|nr:MurR/RpiR family transcriptional regulator [Lactobacillus amylovorus]MCT3585756.1 MurR/RpiR family transcriptional regulator [Lactobacillus amylovorus]